ncbi:MAG: hypothetical protein R6V19_15025 [Armatimonadota bacterium]
MSNISAGAHSEDKKRRSRAQQPTNNWDRVPVTIIDERTGERIEAAFVPAEELEDEETDRPGQ